MVFPLSPFAPENSVSRGNRFGRRVSPLILHTILLILIVRQAESGAYSRNSSRFPRSRPHTVYIIYRQPPSLGLSRIYAVHILYYIYRQPPLGLSRIYRIIPLLPTDGVRSLPRVPQMPFRHIPWTNKLFLVLLLDTPFFSAPSILTGIFFKASPIVRGENMSK